ncbi:MAG TPA: hypothetical protein VMH26_19930 [Burkholderiales bacterium]|nr:hypothetical protein [Burkholderiales bacterium]
MDSGSYNRLVLLLAACATLVLAGFNFIVDPYGNFDVPRIAGLNELHLGFNRHPLLAKSLAASRIEPTSIVLGNSRPESAYEPGHSGFESPAYNLAVGGARLGQVRRYLLEALATGRLRQVFLATDLGMFDPSLGTDQDIPEVFMLTNDSGKSAGAARKWLRLAFVLLSGTASTDSWWSFRHQGDPVVVYLPSGVREESADERQVEREGGHRSASLRIESVFLATMLRDVASPEFPVAYGALLDQLADTIALAVERGVRVDIVIDPIHARFNYVYAVAGLWPTHEKWKRDLAALAARWPWSVSLWDFSGVSPCTSEPMPAAGDATSKMHWYRESGHFRPRLGALVLDRVLGGGAGLCPGFGRKLDADTIEDALAGQRAALARWVADHAEDVAEIDALARRYRGPPPKTLFGTSQVEKLSRNPLH